MSEAVMRRASDMPTIGASVPESYIAWLYETIATARRALANQDGIPQFEPPKAPLSESEVAGFYRAIEEEFFRLDPDGVCIPLMMRPSTGYAFPLLQRPNKKRNVIVLWREWLTHAALAASLNLDYGYPRHDIGLDVVDAFDVLVFAPDNRPWIAAEAKKSGAELDAMIDELLTLADAPYVFRRTPTHSNSEQKFRSLLTLRTPYFHAVAPGLPPRSFRVTYPTDRSSLRASLAEIDDVPNAND